MILKRLKNSYTTQLPAREKEGSANTDHLTGQGPMIQLLANTAAGMQKAEKSLQSIQAKREHSASSRSSPSLALQV
ncbi:hypothetical protein MNV_1540003 [Candidatus Methanoperedens nitroreducens]|uniref:Uncharacterized protein n=1 Tax=Candidatus Methanoperedens nitratireducens TaxID=1392998 RepID=A0A284VLC0_9EURY|nr:hypothetical protein MNV_1540003 [Candidatus Methanoperedens nitroreducens]